MLYESPHVRVETVDGVATLWLEFPGRPVNALTPSRLREIERAVAVAESKRSLEVLVLRSGRPDGFCGGHDPVLVNGLETDADRTAFALAGQRILDRLATSPLVSVAFLTGPCQGPGLELALACDYRIAVGGPDSWLGFGDIPPCWGGSVRVRRLLGRRECEQFERKQILTAREAQRIGLVDDAVSERRKTIELTRFVDRIQVHSRKRRSNQLGVREELARERSAFRNLGPWRTSEPVGPRDEADLPKSVAIVGIGEPASMLAVEFALRGVTVFVSDTRGLPSALGDPVARGRVTPLEADEARGRIRHGVPSGAVELVIQFDPVNESMPGLSTRTILARPAGFNHRIPGVHPHHLIEFNFELGRRIAIAPSPGASGTMARRLVTWMERLGYVPRLRLSSADVAVPRAA